MDHQLTEAAAQDSVDILRETGRQFGRLQRRSYSDVIARAIRTVAEDPERPGSRQRDELATGARSFHIELAARRHGAASHALYYLRGQLAEGRKGSSSLACSMIGWNLWAI